MITVRYFAAARERAGCSSEQLPLPPGGTVQAVLEALTALHPELLPIQKHLRVAVDLEFVGLSAQVTDGAELALIPPVAGG
jgi:molybdopterin synthase catalytic subunit